MTAPSPLEDLVQQRNNLEARIEALKAEQKNAVIEEIKNKIAIFGLSAADLGLHISYGRKERSANPTRAPVAPKYRDPETGATWAGRGKPPHWIAGKEREQLAIA